MQQPPANKKQTTRVPKNDSDIYDSPEHREMLMQSRGLLAPNSKSRKLEMLLFFIFIGVFLWFMKKHDQTKNLSYSDPNPTTPEDTAGEL